MFTKHSKILASAFILLAIFSSCKKEKDDGINEPITIVSPDSTVVFNGRGKVQEIEIRFTTDRPINYAQTLYEIDTTNSANYTYTYPDTLFYQNFDSLKTTPNNKYTFTGGFTIPDTLKVGNKIRFKSFFKADRLVYSKEFLIRVNR